MDDKNSKMPSESISPQCVFWPCNALTEFFFEEEKRKTIPQTSLALNLVINSLHNNWSYQLGLGIFPRNSYSKVSNKHDDRDAEIQRENISFIKNKTASKTQEIFYG